MRGSMGGELSNKKEKRGKLLREANQSQQRATTACREESTISVSSLEMTRNLTMEIYVRWYVNCIRRVCDARTEELVRCGNKIWILVPFFFFFDGDLMFVAVRMTVQHRSRDRERRGARDSRRFVSGLRSRCGEVMQVYRKGKYGSGRERSGERRVRVSVSCGRRFCVLGSFGGSRVFAPIDQLRINEKVWSESCGWSCEQKQRANSICVGLLSFWVDAETELTHYLV